MDYKLNQIYCQDVFDAFPDIENSYFDLAVVDPPYNLSKGGIWKWDNSVKMPGMGGNWEKVIQSWDDMPLHDYFMFTLKWLQELSRIVKHTGSFWVHGTYHNMGVINFALQVLGIEIINEIVWYKRNSFPNLSGRRLTASHETILWCHTGGAKKRKYLFNYKQLKDISFPEDCLHKTGKQMRTVWDIPNNKAKSELKYGKHETQKPVRLLDRMMKVSGKKGGRCFIPFAGSGSECIACIKNEMYFLAFEKESKYVEIANKRINEEKTSLFVPATLAVEESTLSLKNKSKDKIVIPSLIKWTGSKRKIAHTINDYFPSYERYIEPFLGGGALLFLNTKKAAIASDIYKPLVELWANIQTNPEKVCRRYREHWHSLQQNLPDYYYEVRDRFNKNHDPVDLLFLTRTCVNGIVRFNRAGEFNNSFHLSRKGMSPETFGKIIKKWSCQIKDVKFINAGYEEVFDMAKQGDFIYLDPPYAGTKNRYNNSIDFDSFFRSLDRLNTKGVKFALSFDGFRDGVDLRISIPKDVYKRELFVSAGKSTLRNVLNKKEEKVIESLYLNY
ncbi:MAG: Dam family site-specific DNA-(adenine-N6)-methyltransferase [Candidatus Omnitrophica bacterium]|nr:Dam family site-specific DNA-(adenine-N6)-methyltransferase [Candidatus Omnitrophota bacterium]